MSTILVLNHKAKDLFTNIVLLCVVGYYIYDVTGIGIHRVLQQIVDTQDVTSRTIYIVSAHGYHNYQYVIIKIPISVLRSHRESRSI